MIAYVKGELVAVEEGSVVVDHNGIGMRIFTPIREELLQLGLGSQVQLYTYLNVREDALQLYGFLHSDALEMFKKLINVNGVGPKNALGILTAMSTDEVVLAIAGEDKKALNQVSGIGPKTAARIILDLKDKVSISAGSSEPVIPAGSGVQAGSTEAGVSAEAGMALMTLGYGQSEAVSAVRKVYQSGMSVEEVIRLSLKQLS